MTERTDTIAKLDVLGIGPEERLRELSLPADPVEQQRLLKSITQEGFTWRTNADRSQGFIESPALKKTVPLSLGREAIAGSKPVRQTILKLTLI